MLKRFVALAMVLVMVLGLGLVAYAAVPYPCDHNSFSTTEYKSYAYSTNRYHKVFTDKTITYKTCKKSTTGREIDDEVHNHNASYDYHTYDADQHTFVRKCSKCGHVLEMVTKTCSGVPHVTSPWPSN